MGQTGVVEITQSQYERIADCLPRQRGNVSMTNLQLLNALLYVAEHGCKWRGLPKQLGNWHTIYTRMNLALRIEGVCLDSTTIKVHPDGTGALKKAVRKPSVVHGAETPPRFIWLPRMLGAP
jgi:transposase